MSTAKVHPGAQEVGAHDPKHPTSILSQLSRAIASNSHFLAKAELYFTAFLSRSDMASDIVMVVSQSSGAWLACLQCWGCDSLTSSILTSAFISAQLSHEWDVSEEKRRDDPGFYGYLPSSLKRRCFVMLQLFLLTTLPFVLRPLSPPPCRVGAAPPPSRHHRPQPFNLPLPRAPIPANGDRLLLPPPLFHLVRVR